MPICSEKLAQQIIADFLLGIRINKKRGVFRKLRLDAFASSGDHVDKNRHQNSKNTENDQQNNDNKQHKAAGDPKEIIHAWAVSSAPVLRVKKISRKGLLPSASISDSREWRERNPWRKERQIIAGSSRPGCSSGEMLFME